MAVYKYTNGLFGPKIKDYKNKDQFYDIEATDKKVSVYTKKGEILCVANVDEDNNVIIHSEKDFIAVQNYNRVLKASRIAIFKDNTLIKNTALYGKIEKIIFGLEDVYFMKYVFTRANRYYYQLINDDGKVITPEWQEIYYKTEGNQDRFYCENFKEISEEEYKNESDMKKLMDMIMELEEIAVYSGKGEELLHTIYEDDDIPKTGRIGITKNKEFNESLTLYNPETGKKINKETEVIEHQNENEGMQL